VSRKVVQPELGTQRCCSARPEANRSNSTASSTAVVDYEASWSPDGRQIVRKLTPAQQKRVF
jgi:hypothetical protein